MTRQKKEILRQIDEIERDIEIDWQLAFGMAPPGAYDSMYQQIDELWDELARLRHYESKEAMLFDEGVCPDAGNRMRTASLARKGEETSDKQRGCSEIKIATAPFFTNLGGNCK